MQANAISEEVNKKKEKFGLLETVTVAILHKRSIKDYALSVIVNHFGARYEGKGMIRRGSSMIRARAQLLYVCPP